jgi:hypothetical protein
MYSKIFLSLGMQLLVLKVFAADFTLNDTGVVYCYIDGKATKNCKGTGADAEFGRDVTHPSDQNGYAGFSFTKIDSVGNEISKASSQWSCIKDNVTGLIWENKTRDGTIHDGRQGFDQLTLKPTVLADVSNAEKLCGYSDWRVPSRRELFSIFSYARGGSAAVDERYFSNTIAGQYWTSTSYERKANPVNFWTLSFFDPILRGRMQDPRDTQFARVVRSDKPYGINNFFKSGDEVRDRSTGLSWKRCTVGQSWDGLTCQGQSIDMTIDQAISAAHDESNRTGQMWRVPNFKELDSIIDTDRRWAPAIDTRFFPGNFGLLATWAADGGFAFTFLDGSSGPFSMGSVANVRLVRDTPY